ncbi:MAG: hypothetical protein CSA50_08845 [Gammaproteobacteria bacterium]|nr:MAG: hypothetical protein CSA50_08845 [Gammaproteobacteria bacterium]
MRTNTASNTDTNSANTGKNNRPGTILLALTIVFGLLSTSYATAGRHYNESRIRFAKVTRVEPITRTIERKQPYEECWTEQIRYQNHGNDDDSYTGTILGGVIGGAIGNAVGHKKRNKQIGTAVGALLGAGIGHDITSANRSRHNRGYHYRDERRCETHYETRYEERVVGYNVWYRYNGESFTTRMDHDPGERIKVRVTVSPL